MYVFLVLRWILSHGPNASVLYEDDGKTEPEETSSSVPDVPKIHRGRPSETGWSLCGGVVGRGTSSLDL